MMHGPEPDHDLMILRDPRKHQFIPMNPLFHMVMPSIANESLGSL
jgi:hypothetical protein